MVKFENLIGKFIIVVILFLGLFTYIVTIQSNNNAVQPVSQDPTFNDSFQGLIAQVEDNTEEAEEKYGVFNSEEPKSGFGSVILFSIVSVGKGFSSFTFGFLGAIIKLPLILFGIPIEIYNLIITWLIIGVVVSAYVLYKLGGG